MLESILQRRTHDGSMNMVQSRIFGNSDFTHKFESLEALSPTRHNTNIAELRIDDKEYFEFAKVYNF